MTMSNYICGVRIEAKDPAEAVEQVLFPTQEILMQDTISCIASPGVGVEFLSWFLPITFMLCVLLGFGLGYKYTNDKRPVYLCDNPDH